MHPALRPLRNQRGGYQRDIQTAQDGRVKALQVDGDGSPIHGDSSFQQYSRTVTHEWSDSILHICFSFAASGFRARDYNHSDTL